MDLPVSDFNRRIQNSDNHQNGGTNTVTIPNEVYQRLLKASVDVFKAKDTIKRLNDLICSKNDIIDRLKEENSTLNRKVINMDHLSNVGLDNLKINCSENTNLLMYN